MSIETKRKYEELCKNETSICIYDTPWWLDTVAGPENWDVLLYEKKGVIFGALPYYVKSKYGLKYITQPPLTQHNGVWIKYPVDSNCRNQTRITLEKEVMYALIEQLEQLDISYYTQYHSPNVKNWQPFYWKGYSQTVAYTYRIPETASKTYEEIYPQFSKGTRKCLEKARGEAIIEEVDDIKIFHDMQTKTFQRQGLKNPYSLDFLRLFDESVKRNNSGRCLLGRDTAGNIHCASYYVYDNNWVYQLMSGTDPEFKRSEYKTLLVERALQFACETHRGFDFEGSMLEGVEEYFRKFGANQEPYFKISKVITQNSLLKFLIGLRL